MSHNKADAAVNNNVLYLLVLNLDQDSNKSLILVGGTIPKRI